MESFKRFISKEYKDLIKLCEDFDKEFYLGWIDIDNDLTQTELELNWQLVIALDTLKSMGLISVRCEFDVYNNPPRLKFYVTVFSPKKIVENRK